MMHDNEMNRQLESPTDQAEHPKRRLLIRLIVGQTIALLFLAAMVGTAGLLLSDNGLLTLVPITGIIALVGAISYWLVRGDRFNAGSYLFLLSTTVGITAIVAVRGYRDASALYYLWPIMGAVSILEARGSFFIVSVSAALYIILVIAESLGLHTPPLPYNPAEESLMTVGSRVLMFFLLSYLVRLSAKDLDKAFRTARSTAQRWRNLNETLEERVTERTQDLERRSIQLETTARIAQDAAAMLAPQELLQRTVSMISEQFGFYHTGIYLLNATGDWAVLQAASSEGGQQMIEYGHRLRVGEWDPVGRVTDQGEAYFIPDMEADVSHNPPLDLPETRSELILPLKARGSIFGALDVHSIETDAFPDDDIAILQTIADQIAVAIDNSRLFQRLQESISAFQSTYGEASLEEWASLTHDAAMGYRYDRHGTTPVREEPVDEIGDDGGLPSVSVLIKHRDYPIGKIQARKHADGSKWTEQEVALLETLADQLSTALESARLYRETQQRATREELTRTITSDIRAASSIDEAIQRAVSSLGRVLNASSMVVRIGTRDSLLSQEEGETYDT